MMCLAKFSIENDDCKEENSSPRIAGSTEDMECAFNHENKNKQLSNNNISAIETPTRESHNNKRRFKLL